MRLPSGEYCAYASRKEDAMKRSGELGLRSRCSFQMLASRKEWLNASRFPCGARAGLEAPVPAHASRFASSEPDMAMRYSAESSPPGEAKTIARPSFIQAGPRGS